MTYFQKLGSSSKFKVGDLVKNIDCGAGNYLKLATVIGFHAYTNDIFVIYKDGTYGCGEEKDYRLITCHCCHCC
jgi:hypothetical protein